MKTTLGIVFAFLCLNATFPVLALETKEPVQVRVTLEMTDGSRLVGEALEKSLPVQLDFTDANIPLENIRQCEVRHKDGRVVLNLQNGDRVSGVLSLEQFRVKTIMGKLSPDLGQIDRLTFSASRGGSLPAGEGEIFFGGVNWHGWKTSFAVQGDKLVSLPQSRSGFNYGHNGGGRGAQLVSNVGNADWRDYRIECDFCTPGIDPAFNPYGLGSDFHDGSIWFHVADAKENWNECGHSLYCFNIGGNGNWSLTATYNNYCRMPSGYGNPHTDGDRRLAAGTGLNPDRVNGNHYRIEVRGQHIQIWVDDRQAVDVTDDKMNETIGGQTLDHGGVGFVGEFDAMVWIKNFSATRL